MEDENGSDEERISAMKAAISHQSKVRLECTAGLGCDRHMMGLMCAARELGMDMPAVFTDKVGSRRASLYIITFCRNHITRCVHDILPLTAVSTMTIDRISTIMLRCYVHWFYLPPRINSGIWSAHEVVDQPGTDSFGYAGTGSCTGEHSRRFWSYLSRWLRCSLHH